MAQYHEHFIVNMDRHENLESYNENIFFLLFNLEYHIKYFDTKLILI